MKYWQILEGTLTVKYPSEPPTQARTKPGFVASETKPLFQPWENANVDYGNLIREIEKYEYVAGIKQTTTIISNENDNTTDFLGMNILSKYVIGKGSNVETYLKIIAHLEGEWLNDKFETIAQSNDTSILTDIENQILSSLISQFIDEKDKFWGLSAQRFIQWWIMFNEYAEDKVKELFKPINTYLGI